MKLHEQIFLEIKNQKHQYKNMGELLGSLSFSLGETKENVAKCINKMLRDGELIENSKRELVVPSSLGVFRGTVCGNAKGFGFITPKFGGRQGFEFKKGQREDVFVPASMLFGALDGDEVLFRLEGKDSGAVIKILKRANKIVVGKISKGNNSIVKGFRLDSENYYVICDNTKFSKPILIPSREIGNAKDGNSVKVEITFQPEGAKASMPVGKVIEVLTGTDVENGVASILCDNQIPSVFPDKVLKEAESLKTDFDKEKKKRVDLTEKLIVTIDGADAKDLDDAISLEKDGENYVLGVHIADVGNYVPQNSEIDKEAYLRGTSVYFPGRVYPMLPTKLSNDLCSLNPNEEKLALSVVMTIDKFGEVKESKIFESVIKSSARLTYDQVQEVLRNNEKAEDGGFFDFNNKILDSSDVQKFIISQTTPQIEQMLVEMNNLSVKVGNLRERAGALDLDLPETYFEMDGNRVVDVRRRERDNSHKLIENFMVLANRVVAQTFCELDLPFVYRIHGEPAKLRVMEVVDVLNSFGLDIKQSKKVDAIYIQKILKQLSKTELSDVGSSLVLRALEKAIYSEECLGHFGLALQYYCHFTSPIRRYPDLTIHRIIKQALKGCPNNILETANMNKSAIRKLFKGNYDLEEFVIESAFQSSERERKADEAERDADDLFKAKFMEDKIGNVYSGKISGVSSFGLFVQLENTVEGLIKIDSLPADDYIFDEKKFVLKGRKRKFTIGQELKVKVIASNLTTRKIEFLLVE